MLRQTLFVGAVAASLLFPTSMLLARGGGGHGGGGGHMGGGHMGGGVRMGGVPHMGGVRVGGGPVVRRGMRVGGGGRRFWNGRWYAYGVGPCWRLTPTGYVWVCG